MLQTLTELIDLEQFSEWYPDGYGKFELHDGVIIEMQPTGTHEQVGGFLGLKLAVQIEQNNLPYFIPRQCIVKPVDSAKSGYNPDVIVLDWDAINNEPLWNKDSTITQGKTVRLIIEVVSKNWQDDYLTKLAEYEKLGIPEYWIADYLALGGRRYIGNPKQPTISIYNLVEGEYQLTQFTGNDVLISSTFPNLNLTADEIFQIGKQRN
ncbi:Uma2 family endonuclease [Anabaena sp. FACHB-1237]|uniref:Uma2 family endonuclease n=1 Tax=Anabaena sp. FACHB-1237 TaxID=2692769 RepID=UPI00167FF5E4|nr:Uma2 family endonuclease [Anabaena sp. FACHB-1237]MBD2137342.1 Uma2 family endonuclease [Anabaena sp. FACHB-1237]